MKKYIRVIAIMGIFTLISGLFACSKPNNERNIENSSNKSNIRFSALTQEEKQKYVKDYLLNNYSVECDLMEIDYKQISMFESEDKFFTVATTPDDYWFAIWITKDGEIVDTEFVYEMKDEINSYIKDLLTKNGISCDVKDRVALEEPPTKKWNTGEASEMISKEKISHNIHLYNIRHEITEEDIVNALSHLNGAVYIHYSDSFNIDEYDKFIDLD